MSNLHLRPIASALLRNRTGALLVAIQIAIALAVLVNAIYIVKQRIDKMGYPTGMDVANIFVISSTRMAADYDAVAAIRDDLAYLRGLSGVIAATSTISVPLSSGGTSITIGARPDDLKDGQTGNLLDIDEQGLDALGLHLVAGRNFRREEILPPLANGYVSDFVPQVIMTRGMADRLFPQGDALGKPIYDPLHQPATIIGIVERMQGPYLLDPLDNVFFEPRLPFVLTSAIYYVIRTRPGERDATMRIAEKHLSASNPGRIIDWVRPLQRYKNRLYAADRNIGIFLSCVTGLLIAITCLGIFGLATFNVSTRTKQIGTRRAVGARRGDILRYFMVENALITTTGIFAGSALALGVGYWLLRQYQLPRLDLYYLAGGIPVLWAIGQLAVWQPARRASNVPPSVATRTV